eukprot:jgi/Orpsp1_1/1181294/evm.model.c7180000076643.1
MCSIQHMIKILRIWIYGFYMEESPVWFCNLHYFVNHFSNNILVIIGCFIILYLYMAIKYPNHYAKYNKKMRRYVILISVVHTAVFNLASLYEPLFSKYTEEEIASRHNCHTAYRYRLYQFILGSTVTDIVFIFISIYCSSDIEGGIKAERGEPEIIKLDSTYFFTASSGILILIFSLTPKQIKYKLGMKVHESSNHCFEYRFSKDYTSNISKFDENSDEFFEKYDRNLSIKLKFDNLYSNVSKNNDNHDSSDRSDSSDSNTVNITIDSQKELSCSSKSSPKEYNYIDIINNTNETIIESSNDNISK